MSQTSPMGELLIWYGIPAMVLFLTFVAVWYLAHRHRPDASKHTEPEQQLDTARDASNKKTRPESRRSRLAGRRRLRSEPPFAHLEPLITGRSGLHSISHFPFTVGRSRSNDLVLRHHSVSRQHAELIPTDDRYIQLVDLESLNGVYVNEHKVEEMILNDGDVIEFGDIRYRYSQVEEEDHLDETTQADQIH